MSQGAIGYEPNDAWWYVGRFMWDFARLEVAVDEVVQELCQIEFGPYTILARNLLFRSKLKIVQAFLRESDERSGAHSESRVVLSRLEDIAGHRNTIAHSIFTDDDEVGSGGPGLIFDDLRGTISKAGIWSKAITFDELDQIHRDTPQLTDRIMALKAACRRMSDLSREETETVLSEVHEPQNVIPFPPRR